MSWCTFPAGQQSRLPELGNDPAVEFQIEHGRKGKRAASNLKLR